MSGRARRAVTEVPPGRPPPAADRSAAGRARSDLDSWRGGDDEILLLLDLPLERHDFAARAVHELLRLAHVNERRDAALLAHLGQTQRFLPRLERALCDLQLAIERAQ